MTSIEDEDGIGVLWNAGVCGEGFQSRCDVLNSRLLVPEAGDMRGRDVKCIDEKVNYVVGIRNAATQAFDCRVPVQVDTNGEGENRWYGAIVEI